MVFREVDKPIISQQAILGAGLKNVDLEGTNTPQNPYVNTRDFKVGTNIGFCATVKFEDPNDYCGPNKFTKATGVFTINNQDNRYVFSTSKKTGEADRFCYIVKAGESPNKYVYTNVKFSASCTSGLSFVESKDQGSKSISYVANVVKAGQNCNTGWECLNSGTSIRYTNADCSRQDPITCNSGMMCSGSYPSAKCVPKPQEVVNTPAVVPEPTMSQSPPEEGISVNGVCEQGEDCSSADCVNNKAICPDPLGTGIGDGNKGVFKPNFFEDNQQNILITSIVLFIIIIVGIILYRRRN